jgi:predicted ATPase
VGPLLGRTLELELLLQRWRQVQAGMGQGILIRGEPGIGKSRLTQELVFQARHTPHLFLECRCTVEGRDSPLRPMVDLLERLLGLGRGLTPEQTTAALEALLSQYGLEPAEFLPLFAALLAIPGASTLNPLQAMSSRRQQEETVQALLDLFFEMAHRQPVLMVMEDVQWADPATLDLLTHLVKEASGARLCAVLTARPEFTPPWPASQVLLVPLAAY